MLWLLPREILKYEILPKLDDVTMYLLQVALHLRCPSADTFPFLEPDRMQKQIVQLGLKVLDFFRYHNLVRMYSVPKFAVMTGQLAVLRHIEYNLEYCYPLPGDSCDIAAQHGHFEVLKYLFMEKGMTITNETFIGAAISGHIPMLEYLHKSNNDLTIPITTIAADHGHLDFLIHAIKLGYEYDKWTFEAAISHGHLACLKYLLILQDIPQQVSLLPAVLNGHMAMIKFLHEQNIFKDKTRLCYIAAQNGELEILQYLYNNGYPFDNAILGAVRGDHLSCVQYIYERDRSYSDYVALIATNNASLSCLKYLVSAGCPWDMKECLNAIRTYDKPSYASLAMRRWIKEQIALSQPTIKY